MKKLCREVWIEVDLDAIKKERTGDPPPYSEYV